MLGERVGGGMLCLGEGGRRCCGHRVLRERREEGEGSSQLISQTPPLKDPNSRGGGEAGRFPLTTKGLVE